MIKIVLDKFEVNDRSKGNYYYLHGELNDTNFCGWSNFVVSESDFNDFIEKLQLLSKSVEYDVFPELKAGWGEEIYFTLHFERWEKWCTIWVNGELAYPVHSRVSSNPPCSHRVKVGFPIEPNQLDQFIFGLICLRKQKGNEAILNGIN